MTEIPRNLFHFPEIKNNFKAFNQSKDQRSFKTLNFREKSQNKHTNSQLLLQKFLNKYSQKDSCQVSARSSQSQIKNIRTLKKKYDFSLIQKHHALTLEKQKQRISNLDLMEIRTKIKKIKRNKENQEKKHKTDDMIFDATDKLKRSPPLENESIKFNFQSFCKISRLMQEND